MAKNAKSSKAEVDFLFENNGRNFTVEVKSGVSRKMRSLHLLLKTYPEIKSGIVFSGRKYYEQPAQKLIFYSLYYAWEFYETHKCNFLLVQKNRLLNSRKKLFRN